MARPGLEPGTPRFSDRRSLPITTAKVLETPHFTPFPLIEAMFANCGHSPPIRGMERASSPGFASACTDPGDDLLVSRLAGCDTLDETGIGLDILCSPAEPVGVEDAYGQQERGPLLASGSGWSP